MEHLVAGELSNVAKGLNNRGRYEKRGRRVGDSQGMQQTKPQQFRSLTEARQFIGWDQPVLTNAVERLLAEYATDRAWDMRGLLVVLPTSIARRRLNELFALKAQAVGKLLYPPKVVTVGELPEHLYIAKLPFAGEMVQNLAWTRSLQNLSNSELQQLIPVPPPKQASAQWLELGKVIAGLHRELSSECLDFSKVVLALGKSHPETPRWQTLVALQRRYLDELDRLKLWDVQTARMRALEWHEASTRQQLLVIACVDMNRSQRGFLKAIESQVRIWIAAPESHRELFDEFGCLESERWQDQILSFEDEMLLVGNSPTDQADLVCACLAELGSDVHVRQVTLGVPDSALIPELKHQLELSGLKGRFGPGVPLVLSEPMVLLRTIARFLEDRSYGAFASLIRHPAVEHLLQNSKLDLPADWLAKIDAYYQAVLPKAVGRFINQSVDGAREFEIVSNTILRWLHRLPIRPQPISSWVQPLLTVLSTAYDRLNSDAEDPTEDPLYVAASQTCAAVLSLRDIPAELEPKMSVSELIDWLLRSVADKLVPAAHDEGSLEMLGWLELMLDDAPHLIITGIHDGVVPESVSGDPFLPNQLRRNLGMMDNSRRFARDLYAMQVMRHTRRSLRMIVGKADAHGDPLVPSRLLMACGLEQLPARVLHLVKEEHTDVLPAIARRWSPNAGASQLIVPRPAVVDPPRHITVTAFRDYLKCPYRFYLQHVLKLREGADSDSELDAPKFGVLIHDTLEALGKSPVGRSSDPDEVKQFLLDQLQLTAEKMFGPEPPAAVLIQIEQAELRLEAFAPHQAARAAEGWEIRYVERGVGFEDEVMIGHDQELTLIGRIDRIDYHPATGNWAIWDYKTSDTAKAPVNVHWTKEHGWRDLQLPMYLPVAEKLGVTGTPSLGYIAIPKQAADTGFFVAQFSPAQLREAAAVADEVASKVAACEFWPEKLEEVPYDDFGRICQTQVQHVTAPPPKRSPQRFIEQQAGQVTPTVVAQAEKLLANSSGLPQPTFSPELIRASAGTGKTYQLTNRLLRIVLSGQEVDTVLATTFTRKAAGEIMHRLLQRLATSCLDDAVSQQLQDALPDVDASPAACLAALKRVTASIHRLRVSTLDSFFAQVARTFSFEMGLPPGWTPMEPLDEPQVQMQAVGQMLDRHERKTLVNLVRMLAKGESGRRVADEILRTVNNGYEAYRGTTREEWDQLPLPPAPSESALESALLTLDQTRVGNKNVDPQLERLHLLASTGNWEAVISHGIYKSLNDMPAKYWGVELPGNLVVAIQAISERAVAELLPIRRSQTLASYDVIDAFDAEYTSLIRRQRALAFADVTYYLSKWMTHSPADQESKTSKNSKSGSVAAEQLEFRLDCGVQHLLLDEFQDTSPDQWRILRPLAIPLGGEPRTDQSFFCVGDTKQAIYGWRGGVAEIFDSVRQGIEGLDVLSMQMSYRSSPVVLNTVNEVFKNLPRHENFSDCDGEATAWAKAFPEHRSAREHLPGYVRLQNGPKVERGTPTEEAKGLFLEFTASQIAELTRKTNASVGVLFRTNADVGRMIGLLRDAGVPASQDGGNPLTDSVAVELMLSLIHLADHPGDGLCAFHVGTSPLAQHLPFSPRSSPYALSGWLRREVSRHGLCHMLRWLADHLVEHLSWWDQHRLEQLLRSAQAFDATPGGRLRDFEESVERDRVALPTEAQVKVMTIHKSKGLEFDAVFLPELSGELSSSSSLLVLRGDDPIEPPDGVLRYMNASLQAMLPASWQRAFEQHKARGVREALCLLYVAMTRARQALFMTTRPTSSPPTQQFGSLLQSTLANSREAIAEPFAKLFESGDVDWWKGMPRASEGSAAQPMRETQPTIEAESLTISLASDRTSAPLRGLRVPPRRQALEEFSSIGQAFSLSQSLGTVYGKLMHAFFEQVEWLEDFRNDQQLLRRVALANIDADALQHVDLERVIAEFEDLIQLPNIRSVLQRSRYQKPFFGCVPDRVEIERERPLSLVEGEVLRYGTIDRMALLFADGELQGVEIFDFKTDAYDPRMTLLWLDDRIEQHRPQLEAYAHAVGQLFDLPLERVAAHLVLLSSDDVLRLTPNDREQGSRTQSSAGEGATERQDLHPAQLQTTHTAHPAPSAGSLKKPASRKTRSTQEPT